MRHIAHAAAIMIAAASLFLAVPASAGLFHNAIDLVCSDCHSMHTGINGLMTRADLIDVCTKCHDGSTEAPDVVGENTSSYTRAAGGLNEESVTTGYLPEYGHTLRVTAVPPGSSTGEQVTISCTRCHEAHGNSAYRNLLADREGRLVTYAVGTNDLAQDYFIATAEGDLAAKYGPGAAQMNRPMAGDSGIARFCKRCHDKMHGSAEEFAGTVPGTFKKHPTAGVPLGSGVGMHSSLQRFSSLPYRVRVMSAAGEWGAQGSPWTFTGEVLPTCTTCHRAHGNRLPFALIQLSGVGPEDEEGDVTGVAMGVAALCRQCHTQQP